MQSLPRSLLPCTGAVLIAGLLLHGNSARAQQTLEPVQINAPRLETGTRDTPAAVTRVDAPARQPGRERLQLDESLSRVPGVFTQNRYNFAQNLRISSRGFGARAPFGIRGLRIRVDGLPATLPDGQSQVDAIDLDAARSVEVMRGPASALYGNASGGLIDIRTADGSATPPGTGLRLTGGEDGLYKAHVHQAGRNEDRNHYLSASTLAFDGYREQSRVRKHQFNAKTQLRGERHQWTLIANALDTPEAEDPGGLTGEQVKDDRRQATEFARRLDAGQVVTQQKGGVIYEHDTGWRARLHYSRRLFQQQLPFPGSSLIGYQRHFYGTGLEYRGDAAPFSWLAGLELDRQEDDRRRHSVDTDGNITDRTADERQHATAAGLFARGKAALTERLSLTLGGRVDHIELAIHDRLLTDGNDSGRRRFREASWLAGLNWRPDAYHNLYASAGTAFETPTFTEFADPDGSGGFNPALEPQRALNLETGLRGEHDKLRYELALFQVDVDDEILPFEDQGRTFYENAGATRRRGLELGASWFPTDRLSLTGAWTLADYRFRRFREDGEDRAGNRLPGLPRHHLYTELLWEEPSGRFAALEVRALDAVFAENANITRVPGFAVVDLRLGRNWPLSRNRSLEVWAGVHNLLDKDYPANVRINANSDRPVEARGYFEPAPGRALRAGLAARF